MLTTAHPHLDRATSGMLNYAAKVGARNSYRFFLPAARRPEARGARRSSVKRARLHALVRAHRALVRARRVPVRRQPDLDPAQRPPLHRELPLEARARDPLHPDRPRRPARRTARSRPAPASGSTTSTPMRRTATSWSTSAPSRTPGSSRTSTWSGCARASRSRSPSCGASGSRPSAGPSTSERLVDEPLDLPRINYGRCNERPYRYVWGVGFGDSGWLDSIVRADVEASATSTVWSEEGCFPGEPVFVAAPEATDEDEGVLLSVVFDGERGQFVPAGARRLGPERARASRGAAPHPVRLPRPVRRA